jgi:hypothetical protein
MEDQSKNMTFSANGRVDILGRYIRTIWKKKKTVLTFSILPTLIMGFYIYFSPQLYTINYIYNITDQPNDVWDKWSFDDKGHQIFLQRLNSVDNLNKITNKLRDSKLDKYSQIAADQGLDSIMNLEVISPEVELYKLKISDPGELEKILENKGQLLRLTIKTHDKESISAIAKVIRDNIENVMILYTLKEYLANDLRTAESSLASIERDEFSAKLSRKTTADALDKLKNIKTSSPDENTNKKSTQLSYNVNDKGEYLPLEVQIQAFESKLINIEKTISESNENYVFYSNWDSLLEKLINQLDKKEKEYYNINQFTDYIGDLAKNITIKDLRDYLQSYARRIKNRVSVNKPVTETPAIYKVPKSLKRKCLYLFAGLLIMSTFASIFIEEINTHTKH